VWERESLKTTGENSRIGEAGKHFCEKGRTRLQKIVYTVSCDQPKGEEDVLASRNGSRKALKREKGGIL